MTSTKSETWSLLFRFYLVRLLYRLYMTWSLKSAQALRQFLYSRGYALGRASDISRVRQVLDLVRPERVPLALVRIGPPTDGGYLVPDDFEGIDGVISPGVGDLSEFEYFFAQKGTSCTLIDATVEKPSIAHPGFRFLKKMLGSREDKEFTTLTAIVEESYADSEHLLLQMDIEGAEWAALTATSLEVLKQFRILVVEFHDIAARLRFEDSLQETADLFNRLTQFHTPVHFHPNNYGGGLGIGTEILPDVFELTLLRNDRIGELRGHAPLPHPLDAENAGITRSPGIYPSWWT